MVAITSTTFRAGALALAVMAWMVPGALRAEEGKVAEKSAAKPATEAQIKAYPIDKCVVTGEKLAGAKSPTALDYKGREIIFCCPACIKEFNEAPDKYTKELDDAIIAKEKPGYPLDKCVVSGEKLGGMGDPVDMVVKNHLVRLCCAGCKKTVAKDPDKYLAMVKEAAAKKKQ
jgi:YHS domain-containing protein